MPTGARRRRCRRPSGGPTPRTRSAAQASRRSARRRRLPRRPPSTRGPIHRFQRRLSRASRGEPPRPAGRSPYCSPMPVDLVIDIDNTPGALAGVATSTRDRGATLAAPPGVGAADRAELHVLVPRGEAASHLLAIPHAALSREREVVVAE